MSIERTRTDLLILGSGGAGLTSAGKYDVSRAIAGRGSEDAPRLPDGSVRCLPKAA